MSEVARKPRSAAPPAAIAFFALAVALSGCEETKKSLGLGKKPPDEFQVVARAPLSVPPEFTLRPPEPGLPRPQEGTPEDQAQAALFGGSAGAMSTAGKGRPLSPGEAAVLANAGGGDANPNIRTIVDEESAFFAAQDSRFVDRIIFWQTREPQGPVIDAVKEAQRLDENTALGKPVTEGETPVIGEREKGWLEGIF